MIEGARVEHVAGRDIGDPHDRKIRRRLRVVAIVRALGQTIELCPADLIGVAGNNDGWRGGDNRRPAGVGTPRRRIDLWGVAAIGHHNLAIGKHQKIVYVRRIGACIEEAIGDLSDCVPGTCRTVLEEMRAGRGVTGSRGKQDVAVR